MSASDKTKNLKRFFVPVGDLVPQEVNPNEMGEAEFNLLYDNIEKVGVTDPVLVRPLPDGKYRIIGGEHRWEVAKLIGIEEVPVTCIDDPAFDEDQEKFQVVRHNVIRGAMNPQKFMKLYEQVADKYSREIAAEMFGFADQSEFDRLVQSTAKALPPDMQPKFQEALHDIKTIDDLSRVLNELFARHGDTLPYGYMVVDFGGKDSIWLRMAKKQKEHFLTLAEQCKEKRRALDHLVGGLFERIARGELDALIVELMEAAPEVNIKESELPTLDFLDEL